MRFLSEASPKKIVFFCTNYGSVTDGIGHYTKKIVEQLSESDDYDVEYSTCASTKVSKFQSIFSLKCTVELFKISSRIKKTGESSILVLEYPFMEHSPFVVLSMIYARFVVPNLSIILSVHEYERVHLLRKLVIVALTALSDKVIVSEREIGRGYEKYIKNKDYETRLIPSNIEPFEKVGINNEKSGYVFFGKIDHRSKAFDELVQAWIDFTDSNSVKSKLDILTSTEIELDPVYFNVFKSLSDNAVSEFLLQKEFILLPIKPFISMNNATLVAGCIHGCIPIGVFDKNYYANLGIPIESYQPQSILAGLERSIKLSKELKSTMVKDCMNTFNELTIESVAQKYNELLQK